MAFKRQLPAMKKLLLPALMCAMLHTQAQDPTVKDLKSATEKKVNKADGIDTIPKTWKKGALFNLNINQGSLSNWAAGGDQFSFSLNAFTNLYAFYKKGKHSWDNTLDLAYGIVNTTSLGSRKASDRIDFLTKYGYALTPKVNLAGLLNARTQFANGYSYLKGANNADSAALTSKFLAPAYVLLSAGIDYKPNQNWSLFISPVTSRWVIVNNDFLAPQYGLDPGKNARSEFGAFGSVNYQQTFKDKFSIKSRLDLFSNYKENPQNIDIFWSNVFTAKITKRINFSLNVDVIYDDDVENVKPGKGPAPQILQLMGIGFAYNIKNY